MIQKRLVGGVVEKERPNWLRENHLLTEVSNAKKEIIWLRFLCGKVFLNQ